jgi:hypothetical protein
MDIKINEHDIEIPYVADSLLTRKCHKLERMLNKFESDSILLDGDIGRTANKKAFQVTRIQFSPKTILHTKKLKHI